MKKSYCKPFCISRLMVSTHLLAATDPVPFDPEDSTEEALSRENDLPEQETASGSSIWED